MPAPAPRCCVCNEPVTEDENEMLVIGEAEEGHTQNGYTLILHQTTPLLLLDFCSEKCMRQYLADRDWENHAWEYRRKEDA